MYIDSGRLALIHRLNAEINDDSKPMVERQKAYRLKSKIQAQLKDKTLATMRERLMKAGRANDEWEMWKITNQIKDYLGEEGIEWWSTKDERQHTTRKSNILTN